MFDFRRGHRQICAAAQSAGAITRWIGVPQSLAAQDEVNNAGSSPVIALVRQEDRTTRSRSEHISGPASRSGNVQKYPQVTADCPHDQPAGREGLVRTTT